MIAIALIVGLLVPILLSARKKGHRGGYFAAAFVTLILGYGCNAMTGHTAAEYAAMDVTQRAGADLIDQWGPTLMSLYVGLFIGSVLGGLLFRPVESQPVASTALRACPHCAEKIQPAAKVCRYCGRDTGFPVEPSVRLEPLRPDQR